MKQAEWEKILDKVNFLKTIVGMTEKEAKKIVSDKISELPEGVRDYVKGFKPIEGSFVKVKQDSCRKLILSQIAYLRAKDGFSPSLMRWKNLRFNGLLLSQVDFSLLSDVELLSAYNAILLQYHKQM